MRKLLFAMAVLTAGCSAPSEKTSDTPDQRATDLSGAYSDTLPCADCQGIITELVLYPDSTFMLRERYLGASAGAPSINASAGSFIPEEDWKKLKLTTREKRELRFAVQPDGSLQLLDNTGNAVSSSADCSLDKKDRIVSRRNGYYIRHSIQPPSGRPTVLYNRIGQGDITIDKSGLDQLTQVQRAVAAYYARKYDNGCQDGPCALAEALGTDVQLADLVKNNLIAVSDAAKVATTTPTASSETLNSFFLQQVGDSLRVTASVLKEGKGVRISETYFVSGTTAELITHTEEAAQSRQVDRNPDRPVEFPQGGKQIIDNRKKPEQQKK